MSGGRLDIGFLACLVPIIGISTMLSTELVACTSHFDCLDAFPTLSYAATFEPEGHVFLLGMCLTAALIFVSISLFFWYVQLRTRHQRTKQWKQTSAQYVAASYVCLVFGLVTALSLFGLAAMDMRAHHDAHIVCTIVFFVSAWVMMIAVQVARTSALHADASQDVDGKLVKRDGLFTVLQRRSFWVSLRRWRRLDSFTAYILGRLVLYMGLTSTLLFGVFFLCANGVWSNPLGFTAVQEAFFEAFAIVCQLLFMGTLSCELAHLARLLEHSDFTESTMSGRNQ
ncbi:unnamed protein product [Hyaloperonospora brassicae]|uniref:CWH43-like N-terminal domain-containing protein n=1 Tax=Hyaloperonospora brassicae TaxID=162125 RepID=A0AAV0V0T3_HYABA|nr:unnamed protein product [Hyaloperonospora brassicae]